MDEVFSKPRLHDTTLPPVHDRFVWRDQPAEPSSLDDFRLDDDFSSPLPFDASEGGLWNGNFPPPPPRPPFLTEDVETDGLTTCDLCTWAFTGKRNNFFTLTKTMEAPVEISWVLTLVIVSLISAIVGAVIMVTFLHWRRLKNTGSSGLCCSVCRDDEPIERRPRANRQSTLRMRTRGPAPSPPDIADNVDNNKTTSHDDHANGNAAMQSSRVWSWWLSSRRNNSSPIIQLQSQSPTVENHYTHMDEPYSSVTGHNGHEGLYAELDRDSTYSRAYQNTAYTNNTEEAEEPASALSSAYYSDLSVQTVPDRSYEIVGMTNNWSNAPVTICTVMPTLANENVRRQTPAIRLSAINETVVVHPSDYV